MRVVLTIFCLLMILLVGGCVINFGEGAGIIALASWAVVGLNLLLIVATWLATPALVWVFYVIAALDVGAALLVGGLSFSDGGSDLEIVLMGLGIAVGFASKAWLALAVARRQKAAG